MDTHNIHLGEWTPQGRGTDGRAIYMYGDPSNPSSYQLFLNSDGKTGTLYRGGHLAGTGTIGTYEPGSSGSSSSTTTLPATGANPSRDDHEAQRQRAAAMKKQAEEEKTAQAAEAEKVRKEKEAAAQAAAAGSGSAGGSGTSAASPASQSDSRKTSSATRGDHSHTVHGAVDTSMDWKTIKSDENEIVTRNETTHTTMTHFRDGRIIEQVDGQKAYVAAKGERNETTANAPGEVSEHGLGGGYVPGTNVRPESPAQIAAKAEEARGDELNKHYHLGQYANNLDANASNSLNKAISHLENGSPPDAFSRSLDKPSSTWHANANWEAPNADNKAAISQIAPGIDTNNVLEVRAGEHNNYLLRMKDGTYNSIDLNNGNVSGAGTWNKDQWAAGGYGSSNSSTEPTPAVVTAANSSTASSPPTTPGLSALEQVDGFGLTAQTQTTPTVAARQPDGNTLADQYSGRVNTSAIDKSLIDMGIVPAAPAPSPSAPDTSDVVSRFIPNHSATPDVEPFTLPGASRQQDQFAVSLDPPPSGPSRMEQHLKFGRDPE